MIFSRKLSLKLFSFLLFVPLLLLNVEAAPVFDQAFEFTQPDGTAVTLILNGDEYYIDAKTQDGFSVVRDEKTGWICYAELSADGSEFVSTGIPVSSKLSKSSQNELILSPTKSVQKDLKITTESRLSKIAATKKQLFGDREVINGLIQDSDSQTESDEPIVITTKAGTNVLPGQNSPAQFNATIKGLVIIVDFSDAPAQYSLQQYQDKVKKPDFHYSNGNAASLRTYYEDVSRGVFILDHFVYGIIRAPKTFAEYDAEGYANGAQELLGYCMNKMDAEGFDFSQLSTNSSGEIKALAIMYTGNPAAWAKGMWWHASGWGGFSADGVHTGPYCTDTANNLNPGTLIHEHGHMAAKWPDTYSYVGGEPGTWGVMGGGYCDLPNPYFLYRNGWLDGENIYGSPALYSMNSTNAHFAYFYYDTTQPKEFYIIKPYTKSLLYCPSLPDEGMSIWRIYTDGDNANYPDKDRYVELVHANNVDTQKNSNVLFKSGGLLDRFTSTTTPSSNWKFGVKSGLPSGFDVTGISVPDTTMNFTLGSTPKPVPHYQFNGNFNDSSDSGLTATGYNFPASGLWSSDTYKGTYYDLGQALSFDGVDDYISCPASVASSSKQTISMWVRPQVQANMVILDKFPANDSGTGFNISMTDAGKVKFRIGSQSNYSELVTTSAVYEPGRWVNILCTYESGTAIIFINGQVRMVKRGITQTMVNGVNLYMGIAQAVDTSYKFNGQLDDVRFYNQVIEAGAIKNLDGLKFKPEKGPIVMLSLDETSGTNAVDLSGNSNNGSLKSGMTFDDNTVAGQVGNALSFDGVDDYISLNPEGMRNLNDGISFSFWTYPRTVQNWARFFDFGNGSPSDNIVISRYGTSDDLNVEIYNGGTSGGKILAPGAIELNKWQFFAITIDNSGSVRIAKNGVVIKTGNTIATPQVYRKNLYIGKSNWSADKYFDGIMDDIRIYNYKLSDTEALDIYQNNRLDAPIPFNGNTTVSPEVVLQFIPSTYAVAHDIYFGTKYAAVASATQQSAEYKGRKKINKYNPVNLDAWCEYFWRVDEVMPDGSIRTGSVWSFKTIGSIQRQIWTGLSTANQITALTSSANYPNNPSLITELSTFEIPTNYAETYGTKVHGLLVPATTGSYKFWISGDDEVELWLSTTSSPTNLVKRAWIYGTCSRERSFDQFSTQASAYITLQANQPYYIMALHKEGVGGDHLAVAWQGPDSPTRSIIDTFYIRPPQENEWPGFTQAAPVSLTARESTLFNMAIPMVATDANGDSLSYGISNGPDWLYVNNNMLTGTPDNGDVGLNSFTLRVSDGKGGIDEADISVNVADIYSGTMGMPDLAGMASEWLSETLNNPADINSNSIVDMADFGMLTNQWQSGIVNGLVAHWTFDDVTGLTVRDSYGSYHGTMTNMPNSNRVSGKLNNGMFFDGINDYVEIPGFKGITGGQSRTCSAWIKTTKAGGQIVNWGNNLKGERWTVRVNNDGTLRTEVYDGYKFGTTFIADGKWHHVAVVMENDGSPDISELRLYVDGEIETTGGVLPCQINSSDINNVRIGVNVLSPNYFHGIIDEVKIFDIALTDDYIKYSLYNLKQLALSFNETDGPVTSDSSGNSRNGTLVNGPLWQANGRKKGCLAFDGIDDHVLVSGYTGISGSASRTCSAWIKSTKVNGQIINWGNNLTGERWTIRINNDGTLRTEIYDGYKFGTKYIADGNWHHIAVVLADDGSADISEVQLYVDGKLESTGGLLPCQINSSDINEVRIGVNVLSPNYFQGLIDEVNIIDRALTSDEILQLSR